MNIFAIFTASVLSLIQFSGHLFLALSDGHLSYEELKLLMSSASGIQLGLLFLVLYVYLKKGKTTG